MKGLAGRDYGFFVRRDTEMAQFAPGWLGLKAFPEYLFHLPSLRPESSAGVIKPR